jgi:hypothetical protein
MTTPPASDDVSAEDEQLSPVASLYAGTKRNIMQTETVLRSISAPELPFAALSDVGLQVYFAPFSSRLLACDAM